jgi:hypothetical protein
MMDTGGGVNGSTPEKGHRSSYLDNLSKPMENLLIEQKPILLIVFLQENQGLQRPPNVEKANGLFTITLGLLQGGTMQEWSRF